MAGDWKRTSLRRAGVKLIDGDHRPPPAADSGYPHIAIPQKEGRLPLGDVRRISPEHIAEWRTRLIASLPKKLRSSLPSVAEIEAELGNLHKSSRYKLD